MDRKLAGLGGGEKACRAVADLGRAWLEEFWRETGLLEGTEGALWEPFLRSAHFFLETWEPEAPLRDEIEALVREIEDRGTGSGLCGFAHGDFLATNLIVDRERVGAVDWEFGERRAFSWLDPVHFAVDLSLRHGLRAGRDRQESFERGFFARGWERDLARSFLDSCFAEGGVPADTLPRALPAYLLFATHRMARFFSPHYPVTVAWKRMVERCLRPGARDELVTPASV
jgi:hypothetical protein